MQLNKFNFFIFTVMLCLNFSDMAVAAESFGRVGSNLGFGSSSTSNELSQSEGPLTSLFFVEYNLSSKYVLSAEHLRTVSSSPPSSAVSFTGLSAKMYYPNNVPGPWYDISTMPPNTMQTRDIASYFGISLGFAQSSLLPDEFGKSSNSAGIYFGLKAGADYQLNHRWGVRTELDIYQTLMGVGNISLTGLSVGLYLLL